jgi:hypothetical protein
VSGDNCHNEILKKICKKHGMAKNINEKCGISYNIYDILILGIE